VLSFSVFALFCWTISGDTAVIDTHLLEQYSNPLIHKLQTLLGRHTSRTKHQPMTEHRQEEKTSLDKTASHQNMEIKSRHDVTMLGISLPRSTQCKISIFSLLNTGIGNAKTIQTCKATATTSRRIRASVSAEP
jgi:hypothetical protein